MKRSMVCLLPFLLALASGCTFYPAHAEIPGQTALDFSRVRRVFVETANGHVEIKCDEQASEAGIHFTKFSRGTTEEDARQSAESIGVETGRDAGQPDVLRIVAHIPAELAGRSAGVGFEIEMPPGANIEVRTSNGKVSLAGARGEVNLKTSNGRIDLSDIQGDTIANTSNGTIVAKNVRGNLDLESRNGAIEIDEVDGERINAQTSNGHIKADGVDGDPSLRTSNGSISLKVTSSTSSPKIKAVTSNGSVHLEVPSTVSARLSLTTSNGSIEKRLEHVSVSDLEVSRRHVKAVLNGGAGDIDVQTSNGRITFETVP